MKSVWNVIETAYTKKGFLTTSIMKSFVDGEDRYGRPKTGYEKALGYLEYLEEETRSRAYEMVEFKYGK